MPELPEVESARAAIERAALDRRIADVDDTDTYVCRPHAPGEIRQALVGRTIDAVHRQGKTIWMDTSDPDGDQSDDGPELGLHLGMSGRLVITGANGEAVEGGDGLGRGYVRVRDLPRQNPVWYRFTLTFADGGQLRLFDKRRLGRVRLDPNRDALGPDAEDATITDFRNRVAKGSAPVKARLLDQSVIAGVGNLLADETLWQARISPKRPAKELTDAEIATLRRELRKATRLARRRGGVHTGTFITHRRPDGHCPRCGSEVARATVGSRTTYWCPTEQH